MFHSRWGRIFSVLAVGAVLGVACDSAPDPQTFTYDEVALFAGLDTRAVVMAQEEQTAACMAAQGFEYIPYVPRNPDTHADPGTLAAIPDAEYVAEYGFGLAEQVRLRWAAEEDDPNPAIVAAMSPDERAEYTRALFGAPTTTDSIPDGCGFTGYDPGYLDAVEGVSQLQLEAVQRLEADARYSEIMDEWSRCMAAEGFHFENRRSAIFDQFGPKMDSATLSHDEGALEELSREEMLVALADLACIAPHESALVDIAAEYEGQLVGDAQTYLDYLASMIEVYGSRPGR